MTHLPQVEADFAALCVFPDVLGVIGVVLGVVNHGRLPLAVHLVVPVLGLRCVGVGDMLRLVPVLRLGILRVIKLGLVNPIVGLLCLGVLDHLGRQEIPIVSQCSGLGRLVVDQYLVRPVCVQNQGVEMSEDVVLDRQRVCPDRSTD